MKFFSIIRVAGKKLYSQKKTLAIGIILCLLLSFCVALYSLNFMFKVVLANGGGVLNISVDEEYGAVKEKTDTISDDTLRLFYSVTDDGVIIVKKKSFDIRQGRAISDNNEVLVGNGLGEYIDTQIEYGGKVFTVVGQADTDAQLIVSEDGAGSDWHISEIYAVANLDKLTATASKMEGLFGKQNIETQSMAELSKLMITIPVFYIVLILNIFSVLSAVFLMWQIISELNTIISLLRFNGYSKTKIFFGFFVFLLIFTAVVYLAASLIYFILDITLISDTVIFMETIIYRLTVGQYFMLYFIMFALFAAALVPSVIKICRKEINIADEN